MKNRYQVLTDDGVHSFDTKKAAMAFKKECTDKGLKAKFWDTLDNDFTKTLNDIFRKA